MANSSPTWAAYHALMACRLVALDERPGVRPVGIRETLCQALAKLVMREAGDQTKTVCVNLQLCAGLEDDIEGATHAVVQGRLERVIRIRQEGEEAGDSMEEEECRGVARLLNNLTIETAGTEEEAAEQLEAALGIEVEETDEGKEEGEGTQTALGALEFLTQDAEPSGTTLVDAHNGFNKLRCLAMLRNVRHSWPSGARFTFNSNRHRAQILLCQPGEPTVTILIQEGVTQVYPLSMVLYGTTLAPLDKELRAVNLGLLPPFYADDAAFDGSAQQSAQLLKLLMRRGPDQGYLPEPDKSLFISNTLG